MTIETQSEPLCTDHPSQAVTGTCERCGRFICAECTGAGGWCYPCVSQRTLALPPATLRSRVASLIFLCTAALGLVILIADLWTFAVPEGSVTERLNELDFSIPNLITFSASAISFLVWQHRAMRQLNTLGLDIGSTPGATVAYWFVPFASLYWPYLVVHDVTELLGGKPLASSLGVRWWWAAWILSFPVGILYLVLLPGDELLPIPTNAYLALLGSDLLNVAGALLCIRIIRGIQLKLDERRAAIVSRFTASSE